MIAIDTNFNYLYLLTRRNLAQNVNFCLIQIVLKDKI